MSKPTVVFANGVFDILTPAHFLFLKFCTETKEQEGASQLIVGIDSDEKVKVEKGLSRPFFSQAERKRSIAQLFPEIDAVVVFDSAKELENIIASMKPILVESRQWEGAVVGGDQAEKIIFFEQQNFYSTTEIAERVMSSGYQPPPTIYPHYSQQFPCEGWWTTSGTGMGITGSSGL